MQFDDVMNVLPALAREQVDDVLVGGVAVGLHGFERATLGSEISYENLEFGIMEIEGIPVRPRHAAHALPYEARHRPADRPDRCGDPPEEILPGREDLTMPVQKFRSLEEANRTPSCEPGSEAHLRHLRFAYELWSRLRPQTPPSGVFRYRSIEEANAALSSPRHPHP